MRSSELVSAPKAGRKKELYFFPFDPKTLIPWYNTFWGNVFSVQEDGSCPGWSRIWIGMISYALFYAVLVKHVLILFANHLPHKLEMGMSILSSPMAMEIFLTGLYGLIQCFLYLRFVWRNYRDQLDPDANYWACFQHLYRAILEDLSELPMLLSSWINEPHRQIDPNTGMPIIKSFFDETRYVHLFFVLLMGLLLLSWSCSFMSLSLTYWLGRMMIDLCYLYSWVDWGLFFFVFVPYRLTVSNQFKFEEAKSNWQTLELWVVKIGQHLIDMPFALLARYIMTSPLIHRIVLIIQPLLFVVMALVSHLIGLVVLAAESTVALMKKVDQYFVQWFESALVKKTASSWGSSLLVPPADVSCFSDCQPTVHPAHGRDCFNDRFNELRRYVADSYGAKFFVSRDQFLVSSWSAVPFDPKVAYNPVMPA